MSGFTSSVAAGVCPLLLLTIALILSALSSHLDATCRDFTTPKKLGGGARFNGFWRRRPAKTPGKCGFDWSTLAVEPVSTYILFSNHSSTHVADGHFGQVLSNPVPELSRMTESWFRIRQTVSHTARHRPILTIHSSISGSCLWQSWVRSQWILG